MTGQELVWLSQDELIFHRMLAFHQQRVQALAADSAPLSNRDDGVLVVHLIPKDCVQTRNRFDGSQLKKHGCYISPLGERGGDSRFNIDGFMTCGDSRTILTYSQLFRDGRLEAAMSDIAYTQNGASIIRANLCEKALFDLVSAYLEFCGKIGLKAPVWLFAALIECEGVQFIIDRDFGSLGSPIGRSPAFLPEAEITTLDVEPSQFLRPFCDAFWQAGGAERSMSYDERGNWHKRS